MSYKIPLSIQGKNRGKYYALVDEYDHKRIGGFRWYVQKRYKRKKHCFYAKRNANQKPRSMHHDIIGVPPKGMEVDHINGNGLDNRRENLRFVSKSKNNFSYHRKKNRLPRGVSVAATQSKPRWVARISKNRKKIYLGTFDSPEMARAAYQNKALEIYGELPK